MREVWEEVCAVLRAGWAVLGGALLTAVLIVLSAVRVHLSWTYWWIPFLVGVIVAEALVIAERRRERDDLQAIIDSRQNRRSDFSFTLSISEDGEHLVAQVRNLGATITGGRMNLVLPDRLGDLVRLRPGSTEPSPKGFMTYVEGHTRFSETEVEFPGANTNFGFRFRVQPPLTAPTDISFAINADELGDWLVVKTTIGPGSEPHGPVPGELPE